MGIHEPPSGGEEIMPHYVVLGNWTDQGIRNVKDSPKRFDMVKDLAAKFGGRADVYITMGQYDFVGVMEMPNDEAVMQLVLQMGAQGNGRTTTLKAWTPDEATKVLAKLQ